MQFGTFHLIGSPDLAPAEQRFKETLEQIALADQLGFDYAWVAEHHFSNYGYSVNPLLLIARAAGAAPRLRFGQAVIVTPFWQAVRLAEDIALTDILTDGRLDLGLGRGYQPMEFRALEVEIDENRELFLEQLALMQKCWTEDDFTFDGRHYQIREPLTILPKPLQRPHPPIWMAIQSLQTLDWVAAQGYGGMMAPMLFTRQQLSEWRERFVQKRAEAGHPGAPLWVQRFVYVTDTDDEAREAVWQTRWQRRVADRLKQDDYRLSGGRNEAVPLPDEASDEEWWDRLVYGTPERCIAQLKRDVYIGFTGFMAWFDVGGIPGDKVIKSMRRFAEEVMPAVAEVGAARA